ncbi:MAG TPA: hypothetical protein VGP42_15250 [Stellaceae bacterium]|jgi:hypothetical protein|nr:hypothetical protein [Stellaceae bacterium]
MAYRISYEDNATIADKQWRNDNPTGIETFETEQEALKRARELIEEGACRAVAVCDDSGEVLGGIRLQLKLGFTVE